MRAILISIIFIVTNLNLGFSQNILLLLDGSVIKTEEYSLLDSLNLYSYKNHKGKMKILEQDFVYSITDSQGNTSVVYVPNEMSYNLGINEMFSFIQGEQSASKNYKPYILGISGLGVGLGSSLLFAEYGLNTFYSTLIPISYSGISVFFKQNTKRMNIPASCEFKELYIKGYQTKANKKRFVYTIVGSLIGSGIGLAINGYNMVQ